MWLSDEQYYIYGDRRADRGLTAALPVSIIICKGRTEDNNVVYETSFQDQLSAAFSTSVPSSSDVQGGDDDGAMALTLQIMT